MKARKWAQTLNEESQDLGNLGHYLEGSCMGPNCTESLFPQIPHLGRGRAGAPLALVRGYRTGNQETKLCSWICYFQKRSLVSPGTSLHPRLPNYKLTPQSI